MANSQYEYVKKYEADDRLLPGCWIVIRLDGRGFTKCVATLLWCLDHCLRARFSDAHGFDKPNDLRGLNLMNAAAMVRPPTPQPAATAHLAAQEVMHGFPDVRIAYGESDEYSFVLHKHTTLFGAPLTDLSNTSTAALHRSSQQQTFVLVCVPFHCSICPAVGHSL